MRGGDVWRGDARPRDSVSTRCGWLRRTSGRKKASWGGRAAARELHRDARAFRFVADFLQDVRFSTRVLLRNPLFILLAALSLAIGIGADTTVFSVANALLFRPPARVREPNRLVDISQAKPGRVDVREVSYPQYADIRERASTLDGVFLYEPMPRPVSLPGPGAAAPLGGRLSPDGKRVGFSAAVGGALEDVWIYDIDRDQRTPLTTDPATDHTPVWSLDGLRIGF